MSLVRSTGQAINITESGNNSNGNWIKFDDGTMICYGTKKYENLNINKSWGTVFETNGEINLGIFPQNFINKPTLVITLGEGDSISHERINNTSQSNLGTTYFYSIVSRTNSWANFNFLAIGKWK